MITENCSNAPSAHDLQAPHLSWLRHRRGTLGDRSPAHLIQAYWAADPLAWSTFGPHAIGAERFATVSSGLQR